MNNTKGKFFSEGVGEMSKHQTHKPKISLKLLFPVNTIDITFIQFYIYTLKNHVYYET